MCFVQRGHHVACNLRDARGTRGCGKGVDFRFEAGVKSRAENGENHRNSGRQDVIRRKHLPYALRAFLTPPSEFERSHGCMYLIQRHRAMTTYLVLNLMFSNMTQVARPQHRVLFLSCYNLYMSLTHGMLHILISASPSRSHPMK